MHNENYIIDRLVSSYSNLYVLVLSTLGNKLRTNFRKLHSYSVARWYAIYMGIQIYICWKANLGI